MSRPPRRRPDGNVFNSAEALAELRRRQPGFSKDQLKRCGAAILPPRPSKVARFYNEHDLEMILVAHRLQVATNMQYGHLGLLTRLARRQGIDETAWLRTLEEQAHLDLVAGTADLAERETA